MMKLQGKLLFHLLSPPPCYSTHETSLLPFIRRTWNFTVKWLSDRDVPFTSLKASIYADKSRFQWPKLPKTPLTHRICQPRADQGWCSLQLGQCTDIWELLNSPLPRREGGKIRDDSRREKHISTYPTGMGRNLVAEDGEEAGLQQLCPHSFK